MKTVNTSHHARAELEHRTYSSSRMKGSAMKRIVGLLNRSLIVTGGFALASGLAACGQLGQETAALDSSKASVLSTQAVITVCPKGCSQTGINAALAAAAPDSTISIAAGVYHEQVILTKNVTLQGAGAQQTILDGDSSRLVLEVRKGVVAVVKGVTIRNGYNPTLGVGGVLNVGTLTLNASVVTKNSGVSVGFGNGGILNTGNLTLLRSTVSKNFGFSGGGIYNSGVLGCFYSTISNNSAVIGNAIFNDNGNATLANCTINEPDGNAVASSGVHAGVLFQNSIIIGHSSDKNALACMKSVSGTFLSLGYNLSNDASCQFTATMDQPNSSRIFLGPLQINAPGSTPTHALLTGSAALDAGTCGSATPENDQRGVARPQNGNCDIGAYEQRPPVAVADSFRMATGNTLRVAAPGLLSNDLSPEGLRLIFATARGASNGVLNYGNDGSFRYTPNAGFVGSDTFSYQITDGSLYSSFATVTVTVDNINHPPVAVSDNYTTPMNTPLGINAARNILANDSDPDSDPVGFGSVRIDSVGGKLTPQLNGTFTFVPTPGFVGIATFAYQASDGNLLSSPATISIQVTPPPPGSVNAFVYQELNFNGGWDVIFEPLLSNWTITVKNNQTLQSQSKITDARGVVRFDDLLPGSYSICQTTLPGWRSVSGDQSAGCFTRNVVSNQAVSVWFGNAM